MTPKQAARVLASLLIDVLLSRVEDGQTFEDLLRDDGPKILQACALAAGDSTYVLAEEVTFHRTQLRDRFKVAQV